METKNITLLVNKISLSFSVPSDATQVRSKKEPHFLILQQLGYIGHDWPWRLATQLLILKEEVKKIHSYCDLMVGMGVISKLVLLKYKPALVILNDWNDVCYDNAKQNFTDAMVHSVDANSFKYHPVDLVIADFNTFTINHLHKWNGLFKNLQGSKWFMFLDSYIYSLRFHKYDANYMIETLKVYYSQLSQQLQSQYGFGIKMVGYPPHVRPNVSVVLAKWGYHGDIKYSKPEKAVDLSVSIGDNLHKG